MGSGRARGEHGKPPPDPRGPPCAPRRHPGFERNGARAQHPEGSGERRIYVRDYPEGSLFSHAIGYSFIDQRVGLEQSRNDELTGEKNEFVTLFEELVGNDREGDDVHTNLDPEAQQVAIEALGSNTGAVVAMEPATGRVRVMASVADLRPEPMGGAVARAEPGRGRPDRQPRDAVAIPAGLDDEGGHRGGRDRQRGVHARFDRQRRIAEGDRRRAALELLRGGLGRLRPAVTDRRR